LAASAGRGFATCSALQPGRPADGQGASNVSVAPMGLLEAPQHELAKTKPKGETVDYDTLFKTWTQTVPPPQKKG
jgi:hypothetical protein